MGHRRKSGELQSKRNNIWLMDAKQVVAGDVVNCWGLQAFKPQGPMKVGWCDCVKYVTTTVVNGSDEYVDKT